MEVAIKLCKPSRSKPVPMNPGIKIKRLNPNVRGIGSKLNLKELQKLVKAYDVIGPT